MKTIVALGELVIMKAWAQIGAWQAAGLRLDGLKVDRCFTTALACGREGEVLYRAIVSMAHALGMSVVAEGGETLAELHVLQELGCDEIQGYLVSRPVPAAQAALLMDRRYLFPRWATA
jgi:EAL domain-containing protein (putative c-di-GMP-specific phosphodiesterase class I)